MAFLWSLEIREVVDVGIEFLHFGLIAEIYVPYTTRLRLMAYG